MKKTTLAALGLTLGLMSTAAYAQNVTNSAPPPAPSFHGGEGKHFMEADTNGDGAISKTEFMAMAQKHFDKLDTNHDGKISQDEMAAARQRHEFKHGSRQQQENDPDAGFPH